ncbi:MAG: peptidase M50 [Deltaproteobacteria bacterium]|nr:peptidase M50 [Deltaproteobacteria bacterium]MBW2393515.1 peptidase M50 [Deltaproteobacteria bacterium]
MGLGSLVGERLFSPFWYRVAELRPRLRTHVRIHRHVYRGQRWYVLENPVSPQQHRFAPTAHYVISLMDGERSVAEIWAAALDHLGDDAPNQGQMITLLAQLHSADTMLCDVPPDTGQLFARNVQHQKQHGLGQRFKNPLYVRLPLWDADAWLERHHQRVAPLFTRIAWFSWCALVAMAAVMALRNMDALVAYTRDTLWDPKSVVMLVLLYPLVKALHELGHAFAAKHWGAPVHEIGLMLLLGMPVPYVDASATAAFPSKRARMVVGAAGVIVELGLAALALFLWLAVSPGIVKLAAFQVMAIGGISTLLFNGNPLIRFDGYYVLADALEIPNLATRANKYLRYLAETRLLGLPERRPVGMAPGERPWLATYAVLAFVYRIILTVTIALFIAGKFFSVGVALAIWSLLLQVVVPAARGVIMLRHDPRIGERPLQAAGRAVAAIAGVLLVLFVLPFPMWTVSDGVVWLPEQAQVKAGATGVVVEILAAPGSAVQPGTPLLEIHDDLMAAEVRVLEAREREARARVESRLLRDRVGAEVAREELALVRAELARARERHGEGIVRAEVAGRFVLPRVEDLPDRFFEKGAVIGYLDVDGPSTIRVVVQQEDAAWVRGSTEAVSVRLPGIGHSIAASLEREVPQATDRLPSLALGAAGGGGLAVDSRDQQGLTALEALFQFDVQLADGAQAPGLGSRARVRFDHGSEPVGFRAIRAARRLFMDRLRV